MTIGCKSRQCTNSMNDPKEEKRGKNTFLWINYSLNIFSFQFKFKINDRYHFEVFNEMDARGGHFLKVLVDRGATQTFHGEIEPPQIYPSVLLYLSDPELPGFTAEYGILDRLKIVNAVGKKKKDYFTKITC